MFIVSGYRTQTKPVLGQRNILNIPWLVQFTLHRIVEVVFTPHGLETNEVSSFWVAFGLSWHGSVVWSCHTHADKLRLCILRQGRLSGWQGPGVTRGRTLGGARVAARRITSMWLSHADGSTVCFSDDTAASQAKVLFGIFRPRVGNQTNKPTQGSTRPKTGKTIGKTPWSTQKFFVRSQNDTLSKNCFPVPCLKGSTSVTWKTNKSSGRDQRSAVLH